MIEYKTVKEFLENSDFDKWIEIDEDFSTRIYYKEENSGFKFHCVEVISSYSDQDEWSDTSEIETIVTGIAYFDGVRHIYFGEEGYIYYPNFSQLVKIINKLQELVKQYCRDAD